MADALDRSRSFGHDPAAYDRGRPDYPDGIYEILVERCGLGPGTATFEIGAGPGTATRRLVALGAGPLVAVEPDRRFADHLASWVRASGAPVEVRAVPFEDADLDSAAFDLGVCATAFHWVDQQRGLEKVGRLLRPGGWWAVWWTIFGDAQRPDPFHDATRALLGGADPTPPPFALETGDRVADVDAAGVFGPVASDVVRWSHVFSGAEIRDLYASFSSIAILPAKARADLLERLVGIAEARFGGRVERPLVSVLYSTRRR